MFPSEIILELVRPGIALGINSVQVINPTAILFELFDEFPMQKI